MSDATTTRFLFHPDTFESVGKWEPFQRGRGLYGPSGMIAGVIPEPVVPANSTLHEPPTLGENQAAVFSVENDSWSLVADFRRAALYRTSDGVLQLITDLGVFPSDVDLTPEPRPSLLHSWQDGVWAVDQTLQDRQTAVVMRQKRDGLLAQADVLINIAEDTEGPFVELRAYRQALRVVPEQAGFPNEIDWPVMPT